LNLCHNKLDGLYQIFQTITKCACLCGGIHHMQSVKMNFKDSEQDIDFTFRFCNGWGFIINRWTLTTMKVRS